MSTLKITKTSPPRFAIINTVDAPQRRMVCEWIPGIGYCYMARRDDSRLRVFDGMKPERPTSIESFGFRVEIHDTEAVFTRIGNSTATYEDGKERGWQDRVWTRQFSLSLVTAPFKRRRKSA